MIDKPSGPSSFAVVAQARKVFGVKKAGHAGTLDPMASGLLICAFDRSTRLIPYLPLEPKHYSFRIQFGTRTDTLDTEGKVVEEGGMIPDYDSVKKILDRFKGSYDQYPPEYSAVKIGGIRAYHLARAGKPVPLSPRQVTIFNLELIRYDGTAGTAEFDTVCSGGTYIRSLVRDIAKQLGTLGHASSIRRTAAGHFTVDNAVSLDCIGSSASRLLKASEILSGYPSVVISNEQREKLAQGVRISLEEEFPLKAIVMAYDNNGELTAILKCLTLSPSLFHPVKVFTKLEA
jgi:tRNA pseudouridine55 synthase